MFKYNTKSWFWYDRYFFLNHRRLIWTLSRTLHGVICTKNSSDSSSSSNNNDDDDNCSYKKTYTMWMAHIKRMNNCYTSVYWILLKHIWGKRKCWRTERTINWAHDNYTIMVLFGKMLCWIRNLNVSRKCLHVNALLVLVQLNFHCRNENHRIDWLVS